MNFQLFSVPGLATMLACPGVAIGCGFGRKRTSTVMEPFGANASSTSGLKPWERYPREAIPPAFGLTFNPGHLERRVCRQAAAHLPARDPHKGRHEPRTSIRRPLLVGPGIQLAKPKPDYPEIKARTDAPRPPPMGIHVHLFVRPTKKTGQAATPFIYCGEVDFVSWEGNALSPCASVYTRRFRGRCGRSLKVPN